MIRRLRSRGAARAASAACALLITGALGTSAVAQTPENTTVLIGQESAGTIEPVIAVAPNASSVVEFFLHDEDDNVMGFVLIVSFGEGVTVGTFDIAGTIVEAIGAETVLQSVGDDPSGPGSVLSAAMFLDKFPPFDGQTLPPSAFPYKIGQVSFTAGADPRVVPVEFSPGITNTLGNFIENGVFFTTTPVPPGTLVGGTIVVGEIEYVRADCNQNGAIDLADPLFLLNYLFEQGEAPTCSDACELNLDGVLDLADAVWTLQYLFGGGPPPPSPFPTCGSDGDPIGCDLPTACP